MKRIISAGAMAMIILGTGACKREATGQVAAVVNGDEITLQEINVEMGPNVPEGADKKAVQVAALQRIIDRRLLAQGATDDGLDERPDYIIRKRLLEDTLLAQLMNEKISQSVKVARPDEIKKFIDANPWKFANRKLLVLDRIQFTRPADPSFQGVLDSVHTMQDAAAKLTERGIQFSRGSNQIDSANLEGRLLDRIWALPAGEPFVIAIGNVVNISVVTSSQPAPLTGPVANTFAAQALRRQELQKALQTRLTALQRSAQIEYQPGFAPQAAPSGGASKP